MTPRQREDHLLFLLSRWRDDDVAMCEVNVAIRCGMSPQQAVAFMNWAHCQVRTKGDKHWMCDVARGVHTRFLRFRVASFALKGVETLQIEEAKLDPAREAWVATIKEHLQGGTLTVEKLVAQRGEEFPFIPAEEGRKA